MDGDPKRLFDACRYIAREARDPNVADALEWLMRGRIKVPSLKRGRNPGPGKSAYTGTSRWTKRRARIEAEAKAQSVQDCEPLEALFSRQHEHERKRARARMTSHGGDGPGMPIMIDVDEDELEVIDIDIEDEQEGSLAHNTKVFLDAAEHLVDVELVSKITFLD